MSGDFLKVHAEARRELSVMPARKPKLEVIARLQLMEERRILPPDAEDMGPPLKGVQLRIVRVGKTQLFLADHQVSAELLVVAPERNAREASAIAFKRFESSVMGNSP